MVLGTFDPHGPRRGLLNGAPRSLRLSLLGVRLLLRRLHLWRSLMLNLRPWLLLRLPDRDLLRRRPEVLWRDPERERRLQQLRWYQAMDHLRAQRERRPGRLGALELLPGVLWLLPGPLGLLPGALLLLARRRR